MNKEARVKDGVGGSNAALQNVAVFGECGDVRNGDARLMVFGGHGWTNWESV